MFRAEDDVLNGLLVVGVLRSPGPFRVILVVVVNADDAPAVSRNQLSDFVRVPVQSKSCTLAGYHYLLAGLSLLAADVAPQPL